MMELIKTHGQIKKKSIKGTNKIFNKGLKERTKY